MYMTEKWLTAKRQFIKAAEAFKAAADEAALEIKAKCGQDMRAEELIPNDSGTFSLLRWYYSRKLILSTPIHEALLLSNHWHVSLKQLEQEKQFLLSMSKPEAWEALWADNQEN